MATAQEIITAAFREGNIIPVGGTASTDENTEALGLLNRLITSAFGSFSGGPLTDWNLPHRQTTDGSLPSNPPLLPGSRRTTRYTLDPSHPPSDVRVVWDGSEQTLYMPPQPHDGARVAIVLTLDTQAPSYGNLTVHGNGRVVAGPMQITTDDVSTVWFYRADLATWVKLQTVAADDDIPFPPSFNDLWITGLSIRLAPRYGKQISQETVAEYHRILKLFQTTYQQSHPSVSGADDLVPGYQSFPRGPRGLYR